MGRYPEDWKSDKHRELVELCDNYCYKGMTEAEVTKHKEKIAALQKELGIE